MANQVEKFGLRPYRKLDGTPLVGAQNRYTIASNYGTAIFQGDMVIPVTGGNIERYPGNTSTAVVGVFNGVFYTDPTTQKPTFKNYYPGSVAASDITAFVVDDPDAVFLIDADAAFTRADLFANYSVTNATGATITGISQVQLDVSEVGTDTTFVVQAIDLETASPDGQAGVNSASSSSLTSTSQTALGAFQNPSTLAVNNVIIRAAGFVDAGVGFETSSMNTPPTALDYLAIISTNDFFLQVEGSNNIGAKSVSCKVYGYRAKADASVYAALVQSEVLSA